MARAKRTTPVAELMRHLGEGQGMVPPENRRRELERGELIVETPPVTAEQPAGVFVHSVFRCSPQRVWNLLIDYGSLQSSIFGLSSAEILGGEPGDALVRFTMKLPFPVGRVSWINQVRASEHAGLYLFSWDYVEGDLATNEGWLAMVRHGPSGEQTYARYRVQVGTSGHLPKSAERLATRWLLPKVVGRLRRVAESS